ITTYLVEDVRFNHYTKRWGPHHFSTVEIGKTILYNTLSGYGGLVKYSGKDGGFNFRQVYGIKKTNSKKQISRESHANDALSMCCGYFGAKPSNYSCFIALKRYQPIRRSLHLQNPSKCGIRERRGGTVSGYGFRKGDMVEGVYKGQKVIGWACSFGKRKEVGIATFDKSQKWIVSSSRCNRICNNPIMYLVSP
ncbi:MAG: hypothetical protein ACE5KE_03355, partial [Methanosarcinales archaeon]